MPPVKTYSAGGRQTEQPPVRGRLRYPLIFDDSRWTALSREDDRIGTTASADVTGDLPRTKHKYFGALVKPTVRVA